MDSDQLFALIFIVGMFAGIFVIFLAMRQRSEQLEMQHRERMAMIERGQVPLAEPRHAGYVNGRHGVPSRSLSIGIIVVGLGLALMTVVSIAAEAPETGVGVGGAVVILGAAFIVRAIVVRPQPMGRNEPPADRP